MLVDSAREIKDENWTRHVKASAFSIFALKVVEKQLGDSNKVI